MNGNRALDALDGTEKSSILAWPENHRLWTSTCHASAIAERLAPARGASVEAFIASFSELTGLL
jgi:hypothetical protein